MKELTVVLVIITVLTAGCTYTENESRKFCEKKGMGFEQTGFRLIEGDCVKIVNGEITKRCEVHYIDYEPYLDKGCMEE